jgi:hypothetical protein
MTKSELRQMIREVLHEEVEMRHSEDLYSVAFKDDSEGRPLFTGTKTECDDFVKKIQNSPATKHHGGVKVSKGADVPVIKK